MPLIIFDVDGTLFCSHLCIITAVKHTLKTLGLPEVSDELIMSQIGEKYTDFAAKIAPGYEDTEKLFSIYTKSERDTIKHEAQLFPGIEELLIKLREKGCRLAVCSNGSMEYIELALTSTGIIDHFDLLVSGGDFHSKSEAVSYILKKLPSDCAVVVGDRFHDFLAASDNNIPSIGAAYGYCPENELGRCTYPANSPEEISALVSKLRVYSAIYEQIKSDEDIRTIGINGVDTSGKTTFTQNLQKYIVSRGSKATVLHLDDFHNPASLRKTGSNEIEAYYNNAFNLDMLKNELLAPIRNNEKIDKDLQLIDLDSDTQITMHFKIDTDEYVLLEGVLLYREPIIELLDFKLYLDIDFSEVLRRAEIRDVPKYGAPFLEKYRLKYIPIQKLYLETCRPGERSDLVIDNNDFNFPVIIAGK